MQHLPREVAALLRAGVATTTDVKRITGERTYRKLIGSGVLVRRPGHVIVHEPSRNRFTPLVEVQLRWSRVVAAGRLACWVHRAPPYDGHTSQHLDFASPTFTPLAGARHLSDLEPTDVTEVACLRVTTPERTLADLGHLVDDDTVERVGEHLLFHRLTTETALARMAGRLRRPGRSGVAALDRFLRRRRGQPPCESDLEVRFLQRARALGFPEPTWRQLRIGGPGHAPLRVDFAWRLRRSLVLVEVDGAGTHANPQALIDDLRRQNVLSRSRHTLLRFTAYDIDVQPRHIEYELGFHMRRSPA